MLRAGFLVALRFLIHYGDYLFVTLRDCSRALQLFDMSRTKANFFASQGLKPILLLGLSGTADVPFPRLFRTSQTIGSPRPPQTRNPNFETSSPITIPDAIHKYFRFPHPRVLPIQFFA